MTTKVLIVNFGPDNLHVRTATGEEGGNTFDAVGHHYIGVQQSKEFYVYGERVLVVREIPVSMGLPPDSP